jgi:hypothetical protein
MEALGGEEVQLLLILELGTRWWVVSVTPRPSFTPGERRPVTLRIGGWVGLTAGLDTEARGKILCLCWGSNPDRAVVQSVVRYYTDWAIPAPNVGHSILYLVWVDCGNHEKHQLALPKSVSRIEHTIFRIQRRSDIKAQHIKAVNNKLYLGTVPH